MKGIYKITNLINNKIYIGSSVDINSRWKRHKYSLNNNIRDNPRLLNAWNKYGEENFKFMVIENLSHKSNKYLHAIEQWWLYHNKGEYNIADKVKEGFTGKYHTKETKLKMSEAQTGRKYSKESRRKMSEAKLGEKHPASKLIKEKVLMIRKMYLTEKYTQKVLGKLFNTDRTNIGLIVNRRTWKHI